MNMKKILRKFMCGGLTQTIAIVLVLVALAGCKKTTWEEPNIVPSPYGNNSLDEKEADIWTIAQVKANETFKTCFNTDYTIAKVTDDIYIRGIVTGNDLGGNMYSEISVQDDTGALIICISQSGLWGYLPLGQEILISLKGLYVGCYGLQPEIGTPYTSSSKSSSSYGKTYVSRMDQTIWHQHFKILDYKLKKYYAYAAEAFNANWNKYDAAGKVATLYNVHFTDGGKQAYCAADNDYTERYFEEYPSSSVCIYTSQYAKFAADTLPAGPVNVTGVVKRFKDKFEFIIINADDVEEVE